MHSNQETQTQDTTPDIADKGLGFFTGLAKLSRGISELFQSEPLHDFSEEPPTKLELQLLDESRVALCGVAEFTGFVQNDAWPTALIIRHDIPPRYAMHNFVVKLEDGESLNVTAYVEEDALYDGGQTTLVGRLSVGVEGEFKLKDATLF
jgi:hypothetical protein